jgi:hypothetical protein
MGPAVSVATAIIEQGENAIPRSGESSTEFNLTFV